MKRFSQLRDVSGGPHGVTLIEVLMSLMIMSIGISSVAVLFPVSVLRSVQATQLTNAAILKYNAEAMVQMRPQIVFDPDGDGNLNEHIRNNTEQRYIIDPAGYYQMTAAGATYGTFPTLSAGNNASLPNDNTQRGVADWYGNLDTNGDGIPEALPVLPRYDGGLRSSTISGGLPNGYRPAGGDPEESRALQLMGATFSRLGDGWETQVDSLPFEFVFADGTTGVVATSGASIAGIKFPTEVDLSDISTSSAYVPRVGSTQLIPDPEVCRIVVFSADGSFSIALPLTAVDNTTKFAVWTEDYLNFSSTLDAGEDLNLNGTLDTRSLPVQFVDSLSGNFQVGRVLLQVAKTHDYNWLLTVRRGQDGQTRGVDVVITHNKGISPDDERAYSASFDVSKRSVISVLKASGNFENGTPAIPLLKKSGFILDLENARWYRVRDFQEQTVTVGVVTGPGYVVTLETQIVESSLDGAALFLPGVIDVYPMGSVPIPQGF